MGISNRKIDNYSLRPKFWNCVNSVDLTRKETSASVVRRHRSYIVSSVRFIQIFCNTTYFNIPNFNAFWPIIKKRWKYFSKIRKTPFLDPIHLWNFLLLFFNDFFMFFKWDLIPFISLLLPSTSYLSRDQNLKEY